jgi:hypothetical protein
MASSETAARRAHAFHEEPDTMTDKTPAAPASPAIAPAGDAAPTLPAGMPRPAADAATDTPRPRETGGPKGPDPVRYGDWERNGKCVDF